MLLFACYDLKVSFFAAIGTSACPVSGGDATLLDLSRALKDAGAAVVHVAEHGKWSSQLAARMKPDGGFNCDLSTDVLQWKYLYQSMHQHQPRSTPTQVSPLRKIFRATAGIVDFAESRFAPPQTHSMVAGVTIAVDSNRQKVFFPGAKPILNHAGSPSTFIRWWSAENSAISRAESYKIALRQYSGVLFQAQAHALEAIALGAIAPDLAFVVRPTCNESSVSNARRATSPFRSNRRAIVYVGSLQERKDQATAIRAFAEIASAHKDVDLHLVGGGFRSDYGTELRRLAESLNISRRVIFRGHRSDSARFVAHSTIVLQTSRSEGVSRTLREAAFLGKPIVATSLSGTVELLSREGAWLCGVGEHEEIGAALEAALTSGEAHGRADCAQLRYRASWSWDRYAADVAALAKRWQLLE